MKFIFAILALFIFTISAQAQTQIYVVAPGDSIGWTVQNTRADFQITLATGIEQRAGISNIAFNAVVLRSDGLHRPAYPFMRTVLVDYTPDVAQASLTAPLPDNSSIELGSILGVTNYAVNRGLLGAGVDTVTVFLVDMSTPEAGLTRLAGFRKQ